MSRWRYIAQRAITGEFLDMELPLNREELRWDLSGAGSLRGTVTPDVGGLRAPDGRLLLEEWGTIIYAEADGQIRWGGIVVRSGFQGPTWTIEAAGFATYPHGIPYTGTYSKIGVDPADVVAHIWQHVQGYADGNLGVTVAGSKTPVRLGTEPKDVEFTTGSGETVAFESGPYELNWWETPDCGSEIDSLTKETPFDYVEEHSWASPDGQDVTEAFNLAHDAGTSYHASTIGSTYVGGPRDRTVIRAERTATGAAATYLMRNARPSVTPGRAYYASALVRVSKAGVYDLRLAFNASTANGARTSVTLPANEWTRIAVSATPQAGEITAGIDLVSANGSIGDWWEITEPTISPDFDLESYADGDSIGWEWLGVPHASTSRRVPVDGSTILHQIKIGYPRLGRRRDDLAFIQGDNIADVVSPTLDGEDFSNEVVGLGAGEGVGALRRTTAIRDGRLRRPTVYTAKDVSSVARMDSIIRAELQRRQKTLDISQITVRDHPNAPIGSWNLGDDVLIQATIPWLGDVNLWCRITSWALTSETTAVLNLARSDSFTYGG